MACDRPFAQEPTPTPVPASPTRLAVPDDTAARIVEAARERLRHEVVYDGAYVKIPFPGGDVAPDRGVCTDEVVRIFRALGHDLQKLVHDDLRAAPGAYPNSWPGPRPDPHIDHRRVPNLMAFFARRGFSLPITDKPTDYAPGDVVAWRLDNGLTHIGVLTDDTSDGVTPAVVHNIGAGPRLENVLFAWIIIGHYRFPKR
ncbi:MAG: DUF1287 domain-containing protein [Deltaproteobacteria bacterium]|nr:DUF1287 domain-containing protein [Deltaproteobacteria bacterium]